MRSRNSSFPDAIVETVTRYIGHEVSLTDDFDDDVGLDSIDRLNLMTAVEQAHDIELSDQEIASISTLRDLLNLLKADLGEGDSDAGNQERKAAKAASPPASGS